MNLVSLCVALRKEMTQISSSVSIGSLMRTAGKRATNHVRYSLPRRSGWVKLWSRPVQAATVTTVCLPA